MAVNRLYSTILKRGEYMTLLQDVQDNFGVDQLISAISATVTFLAFLLTFGTLIYNSRKEKREAENRSEKTLVILDFIFENYNEKIETHLKEMKKIRENTTDGISYISRTVYKSDEVEKWKETRDRTLNIFYCIDTASIDKYGQIEKRQQAVTRFEDNYIILETYRYLDSQNFIKNLIEYEENLKTSLKNQHLNITADSIAAISERIQAIKKSLKIFNLIDVKELIEITVHEKHTPDEEISTIMNKDISTFINEEREKLVTIENDLQKVIKPLSNGVIK